MAIAFKRRQTSLPEIRGYSEAFKAGYKDASSMDHTGWPIHEVPREDNVVASLVDIAAIISSDLATGSDCDYEVRWLAGMICGWLRKEQ